MGFLGILLLYNESAKSIYNDFQVIKGDICAKNLAQLTDLGCAAVGFQFAKSCSRPGEAITPVSEHMDLRIGGP